MTALSAPDPRAAALMRLAVATREKLDAGVYDVYLSHLALFRADTVIAACRELERTAQWFPKVAELERECRRQERAARQQVQRQLAARVPEPVEPTPDLPRMERFMAAVRKAISR